MIPAKVCGRSWGWEVGAGGPNRNCLIWELSTRGWTRVKTRERKGGRRMPLRRKQEGISKEGEKQALGFTEASF